MSKTKRTSKTSKTKSGRKSLKGKWGHIGAPPKPMKFPGRPFVMAAIFAMNPTLCELTVRKNVDKAIEAGTLLELEPIPQKGGAVGRPKSRFVLKTKYVASKMKLRTPKAKTVRKAVVVATSTPAPVTVTVPTPAPTPAPVVETTPEPVPATPLPATEVAVVEPIPAAPVAEPVVAPLAVTETPSNPLTDEPVVS